MDISSDHGETVNSWQMFKRRLFLLILCIAVIIIVISVVVSTFRFTRMKTFYHYVKKKLSANAVRVLRMIEI